MRNRRSATNKLIRLTCALGLVLIASSAVMAGSKEQHFNASRDEVFAAAAAVTRKHYTIVTINEDQRVITYWTGYSLTSRGFQVTVSLEAISERQSVVHIRPAKRQQLFAWGAGDRIAGKFLRQLERELGQRNKNPTQ